jgi:hypothetical protein
VFERLPVPVDRRFMVNMKAFARHIDDPALGDAMPRL